MFIFKKCICGKKFKTTDYRVKDGRGKFCSKKCHYSNAKRPSGLTYKLVKENPTSFKKGQKPWNYQISKDLQPNWKGDNVGYDGVHDWVEKTLGKKRKCDFCKTTKAKMYHWSSKDHLYKRNIADWQRLCVRCHFYYDRKQFGSRESFHR